MFYGLSTNLQYWQERINLFVALAPVVSMKHCSSIFIKFIRNFDGLLKWIYLKFKTLEIFNITIASKKTLIYGFVSTVLAK